MTTASAEIINQLNAPGALANTYVVFISDNGFFQGEHRFDSAKFLPYEPSNHMPLLIRGPGILPGSRSGELVGNVDLAPTILQLTGRRPTATDRRPLAGALHPGPGEAHQAPDPARGLHRQGRAGVGAARSRAHASITASPRDYEGLRIGRYKFIQYRSGARELYDFKRDPYEQHSRHLDPRYREVKRC